MKNTFTMQKNVDFHNTRVSIAKKCCVLTRRVSKRLKYIFVYSRDKLQSFLILFEKSSFSYCVVGKALNWFRSYLHNRTYSVVYGSMSDVVQLTCSVPQGSVLPPLLFVLYTAELTDIAVDLGVNI